MLALHARIRGERELPMPEPTPDYSSSSSSSTDLPLAAGATLLSLVGYVEPASRVPAGALVLTTLLLLLLGVVRRHLAPPVPPRP
jgi:hypothetical protein